MQFDVGRNAADTEETGPLDAEGVSGERKEVPGIRRNLGKDGKGRSAAKSSFCFTAEFLEVLFCRGADGDRHVVKIESRRI